MKFTPQQITLGHLSTSTCAMKSVPGRTQTKQLLVIPEKNSDTIIMTVSFKLQKDNRHMSTVNRSSTIKNHDIAECRTCQATTASAQTRWTGTWQQHVITKHGRRKTERQKRQGLTTSHSEARAALLPIFRCCKNVLPEAR